MSMNRCMNCMKTISSDVCPHCGFDGDPQEEHALPYGTILRGRYLIGKVLGQGGFGITYIGWDLALEQKVAIKEYYPSGHVIRTATTGNVLHWSATAQTVEFQENGVEGFLKEARKMARITRVPEATLVYDTFPENSTAYIVMEFVEGQTLKDHLAENGPMTWEHAQKIFLPTIQAMEAIHQAGIIHRDLSPDNLMLAPDGSVKILDLGAAKDVTLNSGASSVVVAKNGFSPPEQYTQRSTSGPWTDVYALAASIYYSLTGIVPPSAIDRIQKDFLAWDHPHLSSLPKEVATAIQKALTPDSTARTQSMADFKSELEGFVSNNNTSSTDTALPAVHTKKQFSATKKSVVISVIAVVVLFVILSTVLVPNVLLPRRNYRLGITYFEADDYHNALNAFTNARNYADSADKIILCNNWILITDYLRSENTDALLELINNKDLTNTYLPIIQSAAEKGDAFAQYILGECYFSGYGVQKNINESIHWYTLSADQGQRFAQAKLGAYYYDQNNFTKALFYFNDSAAQGYAFAQRRLGLLYYDGEGVSQNYQEAIKLFTLAANQGDMIAQYKLGHIYHNGEGVSIDYSEAIKWFTLSAEQGYQLAQRRLAMCYFFGEGTEINYKEAYRWFILAAEQGDPGAQSILGFMYYYGEGVNQNYSTALEWYALAAEQGDDLAQNSIGEMYYRGEGVDQDYTEALHWFKKAAEQGNSNAQCNIGIMYLFGYGVEENYDTAFDWLILAAEQGEVLAQYNVGVMYYYGLGVTSDYFESRTWLELAAEQGYENATEFMNAHSYLSYLNRNN